MDYSNHNIMTHINNESNFKKELINYFNNLSKNKIHIMKDINEQKSILTLRDLDSLLTYDKKYLISQKAQRKIYTRYYFDAFKRVTKNYFTYKYIDGTTIDTTVGQMNYFKWLFESNIL